jgi:hypothetical protein
MRVRLIFLGVTAAVVAAVMASVAHAQTTCKTIEGPGYFAQACGTNPQVSGGPSGSSASTGPEQAVQSVPTPAPTPADTFTPVPTATASPALATPSPVPRREPVGLLGALLRLLGLG